ncbi:hypothetical protein EPH95_18205 [Salicibibacter halophilus]|uniref:Uncharacterized protein n=1 Tax=Salicibibacter halophilus TaxID=2502791 RepID=A0A514LM42_9BACI|nr:hypothetical protein [Salicibibacter halophilus]QDI92863.1 hypothetical protein EPH95_18205 [Salicibibacter halophilus]
MKSLCITVFVFGNYTKYIPYYIYSILTSYPDYYVKIFTNTRLSKQENTCLQLIREQLSTNFEVKENYFTNRNVKRTVENKVKRFLLPYHEFQAFENVYVGDVDFLIVKESPSLLEGHVAHCQKTGLPYSNQVRPNSKRLTGLHFFNVKPYYQKMGETLAYYRNNPERITEDFQSLKRDEEMLYQLIEQQIGFDGLDAYHYRPHHGFHLGILRSGPERFKAYVENGRQNPFHQLPAYDGLKKQLLLYFQDPLFKAMKKTNPIREIQTLQLCLKEGAQ